MGKRKRICQVEQVWLETFANRGHSYAILETWQFDRVELPIF